MNSTSRRINMSQSSTSSNTDAEIEMSVGNDVESSSEFVPLVEDVADGIAKSDLSIGSPDKAAIPMGPTSRSQQLPSEYMSRMLMNAVPMLAENPEFAQQVVKFTFAFCGLLTSYLTWAYMQELIMTTKFEPTVHSPDGTFPSAAFCVFSNRFLAIIVAMVCVKHKHGSVFNNNVAPLHAFTPCALSNTMSSWSQYASLRYVSFPVQTIFKSSKIIPVMIMGKFLKGTIYPNSQYFEAFLITVGVAIFSVASQESTRESDTQIQGLIFMLMYITFDCFTSQWQDKIYGLYGRANVDPYQMMLGVNSSAICITTAGLLISGDFPKVWDFFMVNPNVLTYNIVTAITSASGQLCIYYTIKEFGPIVFTIIMTVRQMISICISAYKFGHHISLLAFCGAIIVFGVLFYQIRRKYLARKLKEATVVSVTSGNGTTK
jgi:adenosine 3'-phospho 5'-phosphosulfate transporter B2